MDIKEVNNFLRDNQAIFNTMSKIEKIKDSRVRGWAVKGFCEEFGIDRFDVYWPCARLVGYLKNGYFDKFNLEALLDMGDISEFELEAITQLAAKGNVLMLGKEGKEIAEAGKEVLELLEIKWEEGVIEGLKYLRMVKEED